MGIPLVIGVTGHRALRTQDAPLLRAAVREALCALRERCPHTELRMLNSLASGADTLCAQVAAELGIPLDCPLPLPLADYRKDFDGEDLACFDSLLAGAETVFVAPPAEEASEAPPRSFFYRQAGIYVAVHCHILLALWDGVPSEPNGCGAAAAVEFHLDGAYRPVSGAAVRTADNGTVLHVYTPRAGTETPPSPAGSVRVLGNEAAMDAIIRQTEEFNRLAADVEGTDRPLLPPDAPRDAVLARMEPLYRAAGALSRASAAVYRRALALLAAAATVLTMAFLLYDELQLIWMILLCGVMLLAAWGCRRHAVRSGCHRRYIEYRALAEALRVQLYLRHAGSALEAAALFSWAQQDALAWIMDGLFALTVGAPPEGAHDIRACWVGEQRDYHAAAGERKTRAMRRGDRIIRAAFLISVALYVAALVFELLLGGALLPPVAPLADPELCRTLLKLVLGTLSAGALFAANYYGKMSLPRQTADHEKLRRFYARMDALLARQGQTDALLAVIAREELAENSSWYACQLDNTPDFSL